MTRDFFNKQFLALWGAFLQSQKTVQETQDIYWEMLKDLPEHAFAAAVKKCLAESKFFPTIAELGDASLPEKPFIIRGQTRFVTVYLTWWDQLHLDGENIKQKIRLIENLSQE